MSQKIKRDKAETLLFYVLHIKTQVGHIVYVYL